VLYVAGDESERSGSAIEGHIIGVYAEKRVGRSIDAKGDVGIDSDGYFEGVEVDNGDAVLVLFVGGCEFVFAGDEAGDGEVIDEDDV
jgi:hypothetical protein